MTKKHKINFPTILTILRMILVVPFMVFCFAEEPELRMVALDLFVAAAITDFIDGRYARKHKMVTDLGAFLDPLADKMLVNLAFLVLCLEGVVPVWMLAVILVRDFAVDGMRMMLARKGETLAASIWGKSKTMVQMITITMILLNRVLFIDVMDTINLVLLYIVVVLTVVSGLEILIKGWKKAIIE